ncbi:MAG: glycosyltransferase family 2 protein [Chloroflexi bacterium]|nr:glycosyltransferase family 2 protein [Chloroflexota bacterium]
MTPLFQERLLALNDSPDGAQPFITIAIPHYKQRRYLELVLASIFEQDFADLELVVSNDQSPDDSDRVIPDILSESGRPFRYYSQPKNLGYDGNVRFCLAAAQGRYVMLLGNDDALAGPQTISQIVEALAALDFPTVAFANLQRLGEWGTDAAGAEHADFGERTGNGRSIFSLIQLRGRPHL